MEYTKEQLKAAYALNLCTVSVSQIIDYADINIMEQEYEAILNNLNLEQMPKDEALLKILKQLLDIITFFRIQEGDKRFIDKEYQQKMKNAIWAAVPNIGLIVAGGNSITMAVSLASQVGIGYMNYRKAKAEGQLELELKRWQLERTAIEQFNGLRRELFDTAWRLSASYEFSDQLRLTERQIHQYDEILMDNDLIRKLERLDAVKDNFLAYPPFWYHYGNTANAISRSELPLSDYTREQYSQIAKQAFIQYRNSNQYGLLREDPISAACALELVDLLDISKDSDLIHELLDEAVGFSGNANDVLQLCAMAYLKIKETEKASFILRQLVNEQYNTALNAQLLSALYVREFITGQSSEAQSRYEVLRLRVGGYFLYPMPKGLPVDEKGLNEKFVKTQKQILFQKYMLALREFIEKYSILFGKIIPIADEKELKYGESYYLSKNDSIQLRKSNLEGVFEDKPKSSIYIAALRNTGIPFKIIDSLNNLFDASCYLDFMSEETQDRLSTYISEEIIAHKDELSSLQAKLNDDQFLYDDMCSLLDLNFNTFTASFFKSFGEELKRYISSREELQDFSIAEQNLIAFCEKEGLKDPNTLFGKDGEDVILQEVLNERRFNYKLLGKNAVADSQDITNAAVMSDTIRKFIPRIIKNKDCVEIYMREDARFDRYFNGNTALRKNPLFKAQSLAVLNDLSKKDLDLVFTVFGIIPVRSGSVKRLQTYSEIEWANINRKELWLGGRFSNTELDINELYNLIQTLKAKEKELPTDETVKQWKATIKTPEIKKPDIKIPEVKLPEVKLPDVKLPDLKIPDVKLPDIKKVLGKKE